MIDVISKQFPSCNRNGKWYSFTASDLVHWLTGIGEKRQLVGVKAWMYIKCQKLLLFFTNLQVQVK